jgi:hypothetical protein
VVILTTRLHLDVRGEEGYPNNSGKLGSESSPLIESSISCQIMACLPV